MITFEQLTADQRYKIAEFIYSSYQDVLIKPDVTAVSQVLFELGLLPNFLDVNAAINENQYHNGLGVIWIILKSKIDRKNIFMIMDEYFENADNFLNG